MTMYGNDTTGETIEIGWDNQYQALGHKKRGAYVATQHRGPNQTPGKGVLHVVTWHAGMASWFADYKAESKGTWAKLVLHQYAGPPLVTEMTDQSQGVELSYTDSSDGRHTS